MPLLWRQGTIPETEEWTEMELKEDVSGDLQTQVEAITSDKDANYMFVIKTGKMMKRVDLIKPHKILAKLINTIKKDPNDPIWQPQAREKSRLSFNRLLHEHQHQAKIVQTPETLN